MRVRKRERDGERVGVGHGDVGGGVDSGVGGERRRTRGPGGGSVARARVRRGALIYAAGVRRGCLQGGRAGANNSLASGSRNHPLLWFFHHRPRSCLPPALLRLLTASIENVAIVTAKSRGSPPSAKRHSRPNVTSQWMSVQSRLRSFDVYFKK